MKIVTLTRDMRPWRKGEDYVVPDEMAEQLIKAKQAENSRPFPPPDVAPAIPVEARPRNRYLTRKARLA